MKHLNRAAALFVSLCMTATMMTAFASQVDAAPPPRWPISYGLYNSTMNYVVLMPGWNMITLTMEPTEYNGFYSSMFTDTSRCYFGPYGAPGTTTGYGYVQYIEEVASGTGNPDPLGGSLFWDPMPGGWRDGYGDPYFQLEPGHSYWTYNSFVYSPPGGEPPPGGWPPPNYVQVLVGYGRVIPELELELAYGWQTVGEYGVDNWRPVGHEHARDMLARTFTLYGQPYGAYWSLNAWDGINQQYLNCYWTGWAWGGSNFELKEHMGLSLFVAGPALLVWSPAYLPT